MNKEDAEEWTQANAAVMSGGYRLILLGVKQGVPQALGLSTEEWVNDRLGGYVRMQIPERREAVKELTSPDGEGLSNVKTGEVLGVSTETVRRDRSANVETASSPPQVGTAATSANVERHAGATKPEATRCNGERVSALPSIRIVEQRIDTLLAFQLSSRETARLLKIARRIVRELER